MDGQPRIVVPSVRSIGGVTRRHFLRNGAYTALGLSAFGLAACGDSGGNGSTAATGASPTAAATNAATGELETVTFVFPFGAPHVGLLAEHFVAQDLGYFEEEGLNEENEYKTDLLSLIAGRTAEYARVTPVNALNAYSQGQELKMVFQNTYAFVFGLVVGGDSDITEFTADAFRGKKIGITEFAGGEVPMLRALLHRVGLEEGTDVELLPTSGTTQQPTVQALESGEIAAFAGSHLDFAQIEAAGFETKDITPPDILTLSADDCIGVRADYLEENRDQVVRFCRALAKGTTFVLENTRAAGEIGLPFAPESGTLDEVEDFINIFIVDRSEPPAGVEYGSMPVDSWVEYQELLITGSTGSDDDPLAFDEPIDPSLVIDNSLQEEIWDFDVEAIRQQAREYETSD